MQAVQNFYDKLADSYHFIHADWQESVLRHGRILRALLGELHAAPPRTLLDCTCGIGTQALGLALEGYRVHGTDLSPRAIEQAQANIQHFEIGQPITFAVADLLSPPANPTEYDIVLSCDNAVAHFHSDEELSQAITTMTMQLKVGGVLLISLRDYDATVQNPPRTTPVFVNDGEAGRRVVFQVWDWDEAFTAYQLQMFIIRQQGDEWLTEMHASHLRAWQRTAITKALEKSGLTAITWHMPESSSYYQPIVTAHKS